MAKFIKITDDEMINVNRIVLMVESESYSTGEPHTKIFLTNIPFPVKTKLTLDELYKLIEDASEI